MYKTLVIANFPSGEGEASAAVLYDDAAKPLECSIGAKPANQAQANPEPENQTQTARSGLSRGDIFMGRVDRIAKSMHGAFVRIASGEMGYLPLEEATDRSCVHMKIGSPITGKICQGDQFLVQIQTEALKSKLPKLSTSISMTGTYLVLNSKETELYFSSKLDKFEKLRIGEFFSDIQLEDVSVIVRTNAAGAKQAAIISEFNELYIRMQDILDRGMRASAGMVVDTQNYFWMPMASRLDPEEGAVLTDIPEVYEVLREKEIPVRFYSDDSIPLFRLYGFGKLFAKLQQRIVYLKSGGNIVIEQTEAFVSIDVNSAKALAGGPKSPLELNLEAVDTIFRELRLRQLSGTVLVDFINMHSEQEREILQKALTSAAQRDPVRTRAVDITKLGIAEITRRKEYPSLVEQMRKVQYDWNHRGKD